MLWFGVLLFSLIIVIMFLLGEQWFHISWDTASRLSRLSQLSLPALPLVSLLLYEQLYPIGPLEYKTYFGICAAFVLTLTGINIYRSLWSVLFHLRYHKPPLSQGRLLLKIAVAVALTITALICLFALCYAAVSYLAGQTGSNYIVEGGSLVQRLAPTDLSELFYFSAVTYFSLGYGDYLPRGMVMICLVYLEALLGYINSGILIAYAFNLFTKLNRYF